MEKGVGRAITANLRRTLMQLIIIINCGGEEKIVKMKGHGNGNERMRLSLTT